MKKIKQIAALFLGVSMTLGRFVGLPVKAEELSYHAPIITENSFMESGQNVTYDLVSFGTYPQAEVVSETMAENYYSDIIQEEYTYEDGRRDIIDTIKTGSMMNKWYERDNYLEVDDTAYAYLSSSNAVWDENDDCVYEGNKYHRLSKADSKAVPTEKYQLIKEKFRFYNWDDKYHYFKYQPIQWRVLSNENDMYLLLANEGLDYQLMHYQKHQAGETEYTWKDSNMRSWLNGLSAEDNREGKDYSSHGFIDIAFSEDEKDALIYNETLKGKVLLLSGAEMSTTAYGFLADDENGKSRVDEARLLHPTAYTRALGGSYFSPYTSLISPKWDINAPWSGRDHISGNQNSNYVVQNDGKVGSGYIDSCQVVRPVIRIATEDASLLKSCGTFDTASMKYEYEFRGETAGDYSAPVIQSDDSATGYTATYNCIYYGEYPQAEVVNDELNAKYKDRIVNGASVQEGDLIVNNTLYGLLQHAAWIGDETTIQGHRFRRANASSSVFRNILTEKTYYAGCYNWEDKYNYHYFAYQPVKWIILKVKDGKALLLADKVLDDKQYHNSVELMTWAESSIRTWVNSNFYDSAFSTEEKEGIQQTHLRTTDSPTYASSQSVRWYPGGEDTDDKIFFLSHNDMERSVTSLYYGFVQNGRLPDSIRKGIETSYARAMGCAINSDKGTYWWTRTPVGMNGERVVDVMPGGSVDYSNGHYTIGGWGQRNSSESVVKAEVGVRPAMWVQITGNEQIISGGTRTNTGIVSGDREPYDFNDIVCTHHYGTAVVTEKATCIKKGTKTYTCTICGQKKTTSISTTGHKAVVDKAVAATFTRKGKTEGSHCSVCGCTIKKQNVIPMKTGKTKISGKTYFYKGGKKQPGWQTIGKAKYYFDPKTKVMVTGKVKIGKRYYYFSPKTKTLGQMVKGWVKIRKKYYYFSPKTRTLGQMQTGKVKIGKKIYKFNKKGVCLNR